ncbi:MAG: hypothetical protein ACWIPJ_09935, partial [Polaribacter sp.]
MPEGCYEVVSDCDCDSGFAVREIPCPGGSGGGSGNANDESNDFNNPSTDNLNNSFTTGEGGSTSRGGGSGGGGGIVTTPSTIPFTSELKNFMSGTLNSAERTYYNMDSNIKNTVEEYLIRRSFSNDAKSDVKLTLEFAESLNLNFRQFNWAFNNRNSGDINEIKSYLREIITITPEIESFIKNVIGTLINGVNIGSINFEYRIILDLSFKKSVANCAYKLLKDNKQFNQILDKLIPKNS